MSAPDNREESADVEENIQQAPPRYGEALLNGRKRFALDIENISEDLNISKDIVEKIERSETADLPPNAFMQGYIRAYAKLVDVDAEAVLEDFARAVPGASEPLRARSNLPKEAHSGSPLIKNITRLLLACGVMAVLYGIYSYYSEKLQDFDSEVSDEVSLDDAGAGGMKLEIKQRARITDDDELVLDAPMPDLMQQEVEESEQSGSAGEVEAVQDAEEDAVANDNEAVAVTEDEMILYADSDSWVEITSADNRRLFYNLLSAGSEVRVSGAAPFSVFLGNAPQVTMMLNNQDVQLSGYIRANNTAKFRVSTDGDKIVFHKR